MGNSMKKKYTIILLLLISIIITTNSFYLTGHGDWTNTIFNKQPDSNHDIIPTSDENSIEIDSSLSGNSELEGTRNRVSINPNRNLILKGDDTAEISSDFELAGNVTMLDNSELTIKGAEVSIIGWLNLTNNSKLIIEDAHFTLIPPNGASAKTSIINLSGQCVISATNSEISIKAHEVEMEVPFILSTDTVNVTIEDSRLLTDYPPVPLHIRWSTAGLLLLTGSASWTLVNTVVESDMNSEGAYRWCILQSNAVFNAIGVNNYINAPSTNAFIKPNAGNLEAKDCTFIGRMPIAVLGHAHLINTTVVTELQILDNSIVTIEDSNIDNIQIGWWSGTFNKTGMPYPELEFINSKVRDIFISGNANVAMSGSTITGAVVADKSAIVSYLNSSWSNPTIPFSISENVTLHIDNPSGLKRVNMVTGDCRLLVTNSELFRLTQYEDSITLKMVNASIDVIRTYGNMEIHGELVDSIIGEYINTGLENEKGIYNLTLIDSIVPQPLQDENITTFINYRLELDVRLNENNIESPILVNFYNDSGLVQAKTTNEDGYVSIDLPHRIVGSTINYTNEVFTVESSYLGLSISEQFKLNNSLYTQLSWEDKYAPSISEIDYDPDSWNSQKWITVRAKVDDSDIQVISNVTLVYSTNNGKSWQEKVMFNTEDNVYEAIIPRQHRGVKISFYIVAYDMAGNAEESETTSFRVGREYTIIINSLIAVLIGLGIIISIFALSYHRKVKKYTKIEKSEFKIKDKKK
jgi:hypothetical protein